MFPAIPNLNPLADWDPHFAGRALVKALLNPLQDWKVVQKGGSPRSYTVNQTTRALLARISSATGSPRPIFFHRRKPEPCLIRGRPAPCYLFARKFPKDTVDQLLELLPIEEGS